MASAGALLAVAACGANTTQPAGASDAGLGNVTLVAPSSPGSGYDQTARAMQAGLEADDLASRVQVQNTEGAGGTIALAQFMQKQGTSELMIGGLALVGATVTNNAPNSLSDLTPVARMIGEYEVIVVPKDSPHQDLKSFLDALAADPGANPIAIGNQGGVDHIWGAQLVQTAGVTPTDVNFVTFSGGGEVLVALLGGQVAAGISGYGEFADQIDAGELRVLAVSSEEEFELNPDAPTISEAGYPDAAFVNWRGVFAPPGVSEDQLAAAEDAFETLNGSDAWEQARAKNGWTDQFLDSADFKAALEEQQTEITSTLTTLGLA